MGSFLCGSDKNKIHKFTNTDKSIIASMSTDNPTIITYTSTNQHVARPKFACKHIFKDFIPVKKYK